MRALFERTNKTRLVVMESGQVRAALEPLCRVLCRRLFPCRQRAPLRMAPMFLILYAYARCGASR